MDREDRVAVVESDAGVNDFLAAALHFRVTALDRVEIEVLGVVARVHGRGGAPAQTDAQSRTAQLDDIGVDRDVVFLDMGPAQVTHSARHHDRFVVPAIPAVVALFVGLEESTQLRTAEFVPERRAADGAFEHDFERGGQAAGKLRVFDFPRHEEMGDPQVRDHEGRQAGLGLAAGARGGLVADFAPHAGRRARVGRDGRRVVVRLDLDHHVDLVFNIGVAFFGVGLDHEPAVARPLEHGRVVGVGAQGAFGVQLVGVADHREEAQVLLVAIHDPVGVENLVAAVLGIHLAEHDEFDVGRVAPHGRVGGVEVVNLVVAERQTDLDVGAFERFVPAAEDVHLAHGRGRPVLEQVVHVGVHPLGHAVVEDVKDRLRLVERDDGPVRAGEAVVDAALDAADSFKAAVVEDVGGFRRPGREGALARRDEKAAGLGCVRPRGGQQGQGFLPDRVVERVGFGLDKVGERRLDPAEGEVFLVRLVEKRLNAEVGKSGFSCQNDRFHKGSIL